MSDKKEKLFKKLEVESLEENKSHEKASVSIWENWKQLREGNESCSCQCNSCVKGNCGDCSCEDCSCAGCDC